MTRLNLLVGCQLVVCWCQEKEKTQLPCTGWQLWKRSVSSAHFISSDKTLYMKIWAKKDAVLVVFQTLIWCTGKLTSLVCKVEAKAETAGATFWICEWPRFNFCLVLKRIHHETRNSRVSLLFHSFKWGENDIRTFAFRLFPPSIFLLCLILYFVKWGL